MSSVPAPSVTSPAPLLAGIAAKWRVAWGPREGKIGICILGAFALILVFGPSLAPYSPTQIGAGPPVSGPSSAHWFGTDQLGRDVFSRFLYGGRSVIAAPLVATVLTFMVGGLTGLLSGYIGGRTDTVVSRVLDVLLALPPLLIALVVIASLGGSPLVLVVTVAIVYSPRVARVLRGATQGVATQEYVQAAQARGERGLAIVLREILPNITPTLLVEFAVRLTYVIIFITTLNFLGLGVQPPSPNWGVMVAESRPTLLEVPIVTIAPAAGIALLCVGIGLVADAITQSLGLDERQEIIR